MKPQVFGSDALQQNRTLATGCVGGADISTPPSIPSLQNQSPHLTRAIRGSGAATKRLTHSAMPLGPIKS